MADKETKSKRDEKPPKKKRGWIRFHTLAVFAFAGLAWFAPTIIAKTRLRHEVIGYVLPEMAQLIHVGDAELSWTSPVELREVAVFDSQKGELLYVPSIKSDRTLLELISQPNQLGSIVLQEPQFKIVTQPGTSNLEETLKLLLPEDDAESSATFPTVNVQMIDGQIAIKDGITDHTTWLDHCNLSFELPSTTHAQFMQVTFQAIARSNNVAENGVATTRPIPISSQIETSPGYLNLSIESQLPTAEATQWMGAGTGTLKTHRFPAQAIDPILTRLELAIQCAGDCTGQTTINWNNVDKPAITCQWRLDGEALTLRNAQWANSEQIESPHLRTTGEMALHGNNITLTKTSLDTAPVKLFLSGSTQISPASNVPWHRQLLGILFGEDYECNGEIDIARLSQMLPQTVRLRDGMQMKSGRLGWVLTSKATDDQRRWNARVQATKLSAIAKGQLIEWNEPIEIDFAATKLGPVTEIEKLNCKSSFVKMNAQGSFDRATINADVDLDRLAYELQRFFDLQDLELAGQLKTRFRHSLAEDQTLTTQTDVAIKDFHLTLPGHAAWNETLLIGKLDTKGQWQGTQIKTLDTFSFSMKSDGDSLECLLAEPFDIQNASPQLRLQVRSEGELETWMTRLTPFIGGTDVRASGAMQLAALLQINDDTFQLRDVNANVNNIRINSPNFQFADKAIQASFDGNYNRTQSLATFTNLNVRGDNVDVQSPQMLVNLADPGSPTVEGKAAIRAKLEALQSMFDPAQPSASSLRMAGEIKGQVILKHASSLSHANWQTTIDRFVLASPAAENTPANNFTRSPNGQIPARNVSSSREWVAIWREPSTIQFNGNVTADLAMNHVNIKNISVATPGIKMSATGELSDIQNVCQTKLDGQLDYDAASVTERLREYLGPDWNMQGNQQRRFSLHGPLFAATSAGTQPASPVSDQLIAHASLGWNSASAYGFQSGPGDLTADLSQRVIQFAPLNLSVSEGRILGSPQIRLDNTEPTLVAAKTQFADQIRLTPEMCATWMKYATPMLADAARADGRLSVYISKANVPLLNPTASDIASTVRVHSAQIRPGALAEQLLALTNQVESILKQGSSSFSAQDELMVIPEQDIDIRMLNQRIHHRQIKMQVRDMTITTRGSVGLDQTLALVASIPVVDKWVGDNKYLASLQGQTIDVQITGTFSRPQIDQRVLQNLASKIATSAGTSFIQNSLQKTLKKQLPDGFNSPLEEELGKTLEDFLR